MRAFQIRFQNCSAPGFGASCHKLAPLISTDPYPIAVYAMGGRETESYLKVKQAARPSLLDDSKIQFVRLLN
jgi:hypothetical protein